MDSPVKPLSTARKSDRAFSLVEVVMALGICTFVLVALIGLFRVGLGSSHESEERMGAANLVSQITTMILASPTNGIIIPASAMTNSYADPFSGQIKYVGYDGKLVASATSAAYRITCRAGTNTATGTKLAQVYLMLSWPPQAGLTNAAGKYETFTCVPLP